MKKGLVCGAFDLLHAGHMLYLKDAKAHCDYLVVGLHTDPSIENPKKNKPVMSVEERKIMLEGIKYVDEIRMYTTDDDLEKLIHDVNPDIKINGSDYVDGRQAKKPSGYGFVIEFYYHERKHNWSSTNLRERVYMAEREKRK